ncbi:glycosyltransferase family 4 protein [Patescibacteria group bacterium]|nr:glycosyltransferase family 4 protein [Patescibacteria group bacterium]
MRIGIDLHMVNDFMQGSRTYTYNVTRALIEIDRKNDYFLYFSNIQKSIPPFLQRSNVHIKRIVPTNRAIRLPFSFPLKLANDRIDVFHCQYMAPPVLRTPYVVTLHDILYEHYPEFFPPLLRFFMKLFYPYCARRAAYVLTVSQYCKNSIVDIYGLPEEKVEVAYDGVSNDFRPHRNKTLIDAVAKKYGIASNYILFVGRLEPRKNIPGLLKAFYTLKKKTSAPYQLVIVGMKDFKYQKIFNTVTKYQLEKDVIFTGRVKQKDLPLIYNGADLFVYPSFGEGFGIPPLEAMACGVPVITSDTTALPEVVGDAGILINPWDTNELSEMMNKVLSDDGLRNKMINRGLEQSKRFSWSKTAETVLQVYEKVYKESGN